METAEGVVPASAIFTDPPPCEKFYPEECCEILKARQGGTQGGGSGQGGGAGSGCGTGKCIGPPSFFSSGPIRYASGALFFTETDFISIGYGKPWGHTRSFASRTSWSENIGMGFNWRVSQWPYVVDRLDGNYVIQGKPNSALWFQESNGVFTPLYGMTRERFAHDEAAGVYRLDEPDGTVTEFDDFTGMFTKQTAPGGEVIEVKQLANNGFNFTQVERTITEAGTTTTEQILYEYQNIGELVLTRTTLRRKVNAGAWENVVRANYTYYGASEPFGDEGDLKTVTTEDWNGSSWQETGTSYYRYHAIGVTSNSSSSSSSGGGSQAPPHLLKYVLTPAAFNRLKDDPNVSNPLTTSDALVALYADYYFEYDEDRRVTKEMIQGSSQTFLFEYEESENADGYNSWKYKTTETLPDGNQIIVFSNYAKQTMLSVFVETATNPDRKWITFRKYDDNGFLILEASPSAVTGYDETKADLLDFNSISGKYAYLRDNDGHIQALTIDAQSTFVSSVSIRKGQLGAAIRISEREYISCPCGGESSSSRSSSGEACSNVWFTSKETLYPDDPFCECCYSSSSSSGAGRTIITSYDYTWHPGTCQVKQKTTTLPAVPTDQNGSGVSATRKEYFDTYGNLIWQMDERGFITRNKYDIPTGALTQQIRDVDTSLVTDEPAGWSTPTGGGLHLVTDFEHDDKGRITQILGPSHTIDIDGVATTVHRATWMVYRDNDADKEVLAGQGYATGSAPNYSYTLINPVSITKTDNSGKVLEHITAVRASTSGKLMTSDTFAQSNYVRWTTTQYTDCCHEASRRVYHTIPASGEGSEDINFDQTRYGYDVRKRRNRIVSPGGTIRRMVFDARSNPLSIYIGTNDTGATAADPTGGGATGNNMMLVTAHEYDGGNDRGDNYLTKTTQHVDASTTRVTLFTTDWRGRRTAIDGEVDFYQKDCYDNLDRIIKSERYNTTTTGTLIARSETLYDDRGRAYRTIRYAVDPSIGTVGNSLTDNTWFDEAGNVIQQLPSGSKLFTKMVYDGLGRETKRYTGYDLDETIYADAFTVTGDTILEQTETGYDAASNAIQTTHRRRYHNGTGTGELGTPSSAQPKARVTYSASWIDAIGRTLASANYGTNGGTTLSRPSTIPDRSDTVLVTSMDYDAAGDVETRTDPAGIVTKFTHDDVGREIERIQNYRLASSSSSSGACPNSLDTNVTVQTTYTADGGVATLTAVNSQTGNQTTTYVYGTTLSESGIATSTLKRAEIYPDSDDVASPLGNGVDGIYDRIEFQYNRQAELTQVKDQQGTVHAYDYDKLGRQTQDRVTTLGSGVDGAVRRIAMTYEVRGMREKLTSYDDPTVGQGNVVNEVRFAYNGFGQLTTDYQAHGGSVNISTTPKVQYTYASGADNTIRPTSLTYPNGRVISYDYGTADATNDAASRIEAIVDDDIASTHLANYTYLGLGNFVEVDYTQPDMKYTLIGTAGGNDPDTGDIYLGLDRFSRVKDCYWYDYGSAADVDRIKYGYDRVGNCLWRENVMAAANGKDFDELYIYDELHRLKDMQRGNLSDSKTAITNKQFAECWSLDETGNWSSYKRDDDGDNTWNLAQTRTANPVNEITAIAETAGPSWADPAYNKAGNMTAIPQPADPTKTHTATYDAWNRLVKLADDDTSNAVLGYEYDGAKRRSVQKSYVSGVLNETRHLYYSQPSNWQVVEEYVGSSTDTDRQFVWGLRYMDDLVLRDRDKNISGALDERFYVMHDANWNATSITEQTGSIQERYSYGAYGDIAVLTSSFGLRTGSAFMWDYFFTGSRYLAANLFELRHRIYISTTGNWLQRDPYGYVSGASLYQYVLSAPLVFTDPLGAAAHGRNCKAESQDACFDLYPNWWQFSQRVVCIVSYTDECDGSYLRSNFELAERLCNTFDNFPSNDALTCFCGIASVGDIFNTLIASETPQLATAVEYLDCFCNVYTTLNLLCSGTFWQFSGYAPLTGLDCLAEVTKNAIAIDTIAFGLQNMIIQGGNPLPAYQIHACFGCGREAIEAALKPLRNLPSIQEIMYEFYRGLTHY